MSVKSEAEKRIDRSGLQYQLQSNKVEIPVNQYGNVISFKGENLCDDACPFCNKLFTKEYKVYDENILKYAKHIAKCQKKNEEIRSKYPNSSNQIMGDSELLKAYPNCSKYVYYLTLNTKFSLGCDYVHFIKQSRDSPFIEVNCYTHDNFSIDSSTLEHLAKFGLKFEQVILDPEQLRNSYDDKKSTKVKGLWKFIIRDEKVMNEIWGFDKPDVTFKGYTGISVSAYYGRKVNEGYTGTDGFIYEHVDPQFINWNDKTVKDRATKIRIEYEKGVEKRKLEDRI